jgi:branched-subunit amino acid ABC-type transport system permease component
MEARALKKILTYFLVAVILGLLLTLVPLATIKAENGYNAMPQSFREQLKALEGTRDSGGTTYSASDVEIFAISFVIALVVYLLVKSRMPHRRHEWTGPYPYYF